MNRLVKTLSILGILLVTSCNAGQKSNDEEKAENPTTLKSALSYINKYKNYTFTYASKDKNPYSLKFTKNSIGRIDSHNRSLNKHYILDSKGIYSLTYIENGYVPSEYYKGETDLYNCNAQKTLKDVSTSYIDQLDDSSESIVVTDKIYKISFIQMLGYSSNDYVNVKYLNASFKDDTLRFDLGYEEKIISFDVNSWGETKNEIVDEYLASGKSAYVVSEDLDKMRTLFKANNYTQLVYQFGETEATTGFIATQIFNPHYFYYVSGIGNNRGNYAQGAMEIDATVETTPGNMQKLYGCYNYSIDYSVSKTEYPYGKPTIYTYSPVYSKPSIEGYYHYPDQLGIFSNMQYIHDWNMDEVPVEPTGSYCYTVNNPTLVADFASNFSLDTSFEGHTPLALGIEISLGVKDDTDTVIQFDYYFDYGGYKYLLPLPFGNFGGSHVALLDALYDYIHGIE